MSTIFEQTTQEAPSVPQEEKQAEAVQQPSDPYGDLLKSITSQDGRQKYATVSDALNSIPHAQSHIQTLEERAAQAEARAKELEEQLRKAAKVEDVLSQVAQKETAEKPSVEINEQQVQALVEQVITNKERQQTTLHNQQEVAKQLSAKFGDKAEAMYNAKAEELGVDVSFLNDMAAKSPKAVLQFFGGSSSNAPSKTPSSTFNTAAMGTDSQSPRGRNPLLTGSSSDMAAEWNRIAEKLKL